MTYTIEYLILGYELSVKQIPNIIDITLVVLPAVTPGLVFYIKKLNWVAYESILEPTKNYINAFKRFIYMAYQN